MYLILLFTFQGSGEKLFIKLIISGIGLHIFINWLLVKFYGIVLKRNNRNPILASFLLLIFVGISYLIMIIALILGGIGS